MNVLVTGFPHSGTTVLRSIIGTCMNEEIKEMYPNNRKENTVFKNPHYKKINNVKTIVILREPLYVFSSLKKRGVLGTNLHCANDYARVLHHVEKDNDLLFVKYEYIIQSIPKINDYLGIEIDINKKRRGTLCMGRHQQLRHNQVMQPVQNMNKFIDEEILSNNFIVQLSKIYNKIKK